MKEFDLILKDLRVIVADVVDHLGSLLKDVRVRWVSYLEEFMLLLNKDTVIDEGPTAYEV